MSASTRAGLLPGLLAVLGVVVHHADELLGAEGVRVLLARDPRVPLVVAPAAAARDADAGDRAGDGARPSKSPLSVAACSYE